MREKLQSLRRNSQITNSFFLLMASGAVAAFGFVFWTIIARSFPDSEVGIAATLLSLSNLISLLSLAGFDTTFVRFLPKSDRREDYVNSGLIIASILSILLSVVFLLGFPVLVPELAFVTLNPLYSLLFVILNVFTTLNTLTNAIFTAHRQAKYIFGINILFSFVKVVLPFIFISGGAITIFIISGVAQVVGATLSFLVMTRKLNHFFQLKVHKDIILLSKKYSFVVYTSSVLNLLPPTILPLIIIQTIGPEYSAYYYMAFTVATLMYTIVYAAMQAAFAEAAHAEDKLKEHLIKAARFLAILLVPSVTALFFGAPYILAVFGQSYVMEGAGLLQLFALSTIFVGFYSAAGMVFKIRHATIALGVMNTVYAGVIICISYLLIEKWNLMAIGIAWLAGNVLAVLAGAFTYKITRHLR